MDVHENQSMEYLNLLLSDGIAYPASDLISSSRGWLWKSILVGDPTGIRDIPTDDVGMLISVLIRRLYEYNE